MTGPQVQQWLVVFSFIRNSMERDDAMRASNHCPLTILGEAKRDLLVAVVTLNRGKFPGL